MDFLTLDFGSVDWNMNLLDGRSFLLFLFLAVTGCHYISSNESQRPNNATGFEFVMLSI